MFLNINIQLLVLSICSSILYHPQRAFPEG